MTAMVSNFGSHTGYCTFSAAACASARIIPVLDTVVVLAVSIFVCLIPLRLRSFAT